MKNQIDSLDHFLAISHPAIYPELKGYMTSLYDEWHIVMRIIVDLEDALGEMCGHHGHPKEADAAVQRAVKWLSLQVTDEVIAQKAIDKFGGDTADCDIDISRTAKVEKATGGYWVEAQVWMSEEEARS